MCSECRWYMDLPYAVDGGITSTWSKSCSPILIKLNRQIRYLGIVESVNMPKRFRSVSKAAISKFFIDPVKPLYQQFFPPCSTF